MSDKFGPPSDYQLPADHRLHAVQRTAGIVGLIGAGLCVLGAMTNAESFTRGYLVAYMLWLGVALGSMGILMLQYVTGGVWGAVLRRILEASSRTLPMLTLLFIPILLGMDHLFEWSHPEIVEHDHVLQVKAFYLNTPFFLGRAAVYFTVWLVLMFVLNRWGAEADGSYNADNEIRLQNLGRFGLLAYAMTMTFASIDWMMSLEPHWFSHIYGIMVIGGQVLSALAFSIAILSSLSATGPVSRIVGPDHYHDLGKLMLAFIMLWAYFGLSQYLIIWSGNIAEETPWYLARLFGGWQWVATLLIIFHFMLPFVVLLSRGVKRNRVGLSIAALTILAVRYIDLTWLIKPAFSPGNLEVHWVDLAAVLGIGGLWFYTFVWQLSTRPVLAIGEPIMPEPEEDE